MSHVLGAAEARGAARKNFRRPAKILADDVVLMSAITTDISDNGVGIMTENPLPAGQVFVVAFDIPDGDRPKKINVGGKVAYCALRGMDGYHSGMQFMLVHPTTMETIRKFLGDGRPN
ncbi:hypothetical protein BH11PSE11_BH11PSE11_28810 [soil metagenome]